VPRHLSALRISVLRLSVLLGAAIGPGTLLVIALLGPAVDLLSRRVPGLDVAGVVRR